MGRIAVTGTSSFLGSRILRRLVDQRDPDSVLAVDIASPPATLHGVRHRMVDLTLPGADQRLVDVLKDEEVDTVVHAAFFTSPKRDAVVLARARVDRDPAPGGGRGRGRGVALPDALVHRRLRRARAEPELPYRGRASGARTLPWPGCATSSRPSSTSLSFGKRYPAMRLTILRFAPLLGAGVHTFYTRIFSKRVVPVVFGYDPLVQLLHPDDALDAVDAALVKVRAGS